MEDLDKFEEFVVAKMLDVEFLPLTAWRVTPSSMFLRACQTM
jgi:hypothetical protein